VNKFSVFLALVAGTLWGTSGIFATNLRMFGLDSLQMSFVRNLGSAIFLLVFGVAKYRTKIIAKPGQLFLFALSALGMYGTGAFYYAAMKAASISVGAVLMYLAPIIVMTYSVLFMGERFTFKKLFCVLCAFLGTALVTGILGGVKVSVAGIALGVMSGISYSLYNICVKLEMKRGDDPVIATLYCFLFASVFALIFGKPIETMRIIGNNMPYAFLWAVSVGLVTSVAPYLIYTYAVKKIPASVATSVSSVEPLVATFIGVAIYNEPTTCATYIGVVLIVFSVVLLSFSNE